MSVRPDHIIRLQGQDYCTYKGVLDLAHSLGLEQIRTRIIQIPTPENEQVAIVEAEVHMKDGRFFVDVADASPRNVNPRLAHAIVRIASTRAKGRALRDAVNIGEALADEMDQDEQPQPAHQPAASAAPAQAGPLVCAEPDCGVIVTAGQAKVSQQRFGRVLCPDHQKAAAQAAH